MDTLKKIVASIVRDGLYAVGLVALIVILVFVSTRAAHFIYAMF